MCLWWHLAFYHPWLTLHFRKHFNYQFHALPSFLVSLGLGVAATWSLWCFSEPSPVPGTQTFINDWPILTVWHWLWKRGVPPNHSNASTEQCFMYTAGAKQIQNPLTFLNPSKNKDQEMGTETEFSKGLCSQTCWGGGFWHSPWWTKQKKTMFGHILVPLFRKWELDLWRQTGLQDFL